MSSKKRHVGQNDSVHLSIVAKKKRQGDETSPEEASTKCSEVETDICIKGIKADNNSETEFYLEIVCLFLNMGTKVLLDLFVYLVGKSDINLTFDGFLTSPEAKQKLACLRNKKVLSQMEYSVATKTYPLTEEFDVSLLITLLTNLFPRDILPAPKDGWNRQVPDDEDMSTSADLLRLRKIRNDVITHVSKPAIDRLKYDETKDQLFNIFCRLNHTIQSSRTKAEIFTEIRDQLDSYQVSVDSPLSQQYIRKVQKWKKTFDEKVEKVKQMLEKINELELYLTERPPPPYEKYVKLLVEGGKAVLYSMLERVCRMKKLDMKDMSEFIKPSKMNEGKKCLNSNPSSWDVWQLSILLLEKFQKDLSANELKEIKEIYNAASKYAEALAVSLDIDRFNPLWTTLYGSIKCLTMVLDTDTKQKCDDLIRGCSKAEEADLTDLKRHYPDIKTVTDEYKAHINKLRELLSQMIEHGISFSEPQILECKIITLGETKEQKEIAEEKLYTVWQEALKSAEDSTGLRSVRKEVDKTLKRIISIPGVSEVTAKRNCIIVGIRCDTPMSILEVMAYLDHETYHQSIEVIENELFGVLDECIKIVSNCTLNSLHNIISFKDKGTNSQTNGISLPITCDSAEGIMEALKFWQSKELKESSEIISKSLSKNFEQEILLRTNFEGQFGLSETENKSSDIICGYYTSNNDEQKSEDRSAKKHHSAERIEKQRNFHMAASSSENKQNDDVLIEDRKEKRTGEYYDTTHQKVQISIGDCIRPFHNRSYATVGPFVRIKETGEICFLAVRHIFGRLDQPDRMFIDSKVLHIINANSNKETLHECGRVVACVYNEDIDAAVVKLSQDYIPNRYSFAAVHDELLHKEGFYPLKYASVHSVMDVKNVRRNDMTEKSLLKVGCQTGWTKGTLLFNNEKINTENATIQFRHDYPNQYLIQAVPYNNYIHIKGFNGQNFALNKDDGSSVYLLDDNGQLQCIGILCRKMNYTDEYLIKQVDIILKQLGTQMEKTLELDIYEKMTDEVDPYDKELFNHTLKDGYEYDSQMRINIIGFFAQGKTTLTRRLLGEHLDQIAGTDSIEVFVRKCKIQENMWTRCDKTDLYEECSWRLVDITNREHICPQDFEKENCKDETDSAVKVFEMEISIHDTNDMQSNTLKGSNTALVNKLPYNQHTHITKEKDDQLQRLFSNHLRDSDSTDKEVLLANIWDFGGQFIYYATHQIFHSKEAIYLLVFDLTKDLDAIIIDCDFPDRQEKMRNSLLFWVNSIHAYVGDDDDTENIKPIIILVGTHKDKYKGSIESKLREVFDLFAGTRFRKHIYEKPFAVSSLDPADKGIQDLKREIYVLGINNAKQYKIPAKWLPLEIAMLRERDEKNKQILEMKDIIYLDSLNTYPISDKTELKKFLNYHHAKGTIVFFDEEDLDKYIVLKPQFIINAFRCIISAKWFSRWNYTLHQNAYSLTQNAILEQEFLQEVWTEDGFIKFKDILLMFLKKHGILAELRQIDEETGNVKLLGKYMIPSLLKSELDLHQTNNFLQHKKYTVVLLGLELEGLITTTIFEKCTAALLGKWPPIKYNDQILVSQHEGFYRLDLQHAGLIQKSGENIELMVINLCPEDHPEKTVCDRFRRYIEMVVSCEKSGKQANVKPYNHYFKCNDSQHMGHGSHNIHYLNDIRNKTKICCPDNESHPIKVQEAIAEWFKGEGMTNYETSILRKLSRDKLVSKVAQEYGTNWKIFGSAIGLSSEDLQIIRYQCYEPKDVKIFIFEMFRVWKEKYPDDSVYMQEKENQTEDITNVDWDKVRNCLDVQ